MDWSSSPREILAALWDGSGIQIVDVAKSTAEPDRDRLSVAVDSRGGMPAIHTGFDLALTTAVHAPAPWVSVPAAQLDVALAAVFAGFEATPVASAIARLVFRLSPSLAFDDAVALESLAYSTLLAGGEFKAWRARHPAATKQSAEGRVKLRDVGEGWVVELDRAEARNAFDARMRDALVEALEAVAVDPRGGPMELRGAGPAFSAGGDLAEFGQASDTALAHLIRVRQSPARLINSMRERVTARIHGACIGAGMEVPAAAGHVIAAPDTFIRLPEIGMGLIPGAGGCASIPRRIGPQRALYLALCGSTIDADTALHWGLVDAIEGERQ